MKKKKFEKSSADKEMGGMKESDKGEIAMDAKQMSTAGMGVEAKKGEDGGADDHEAEMAMNDLMRAEEHKSNHKLMARVHKKVGRKHKSIQALKDTYNEKFGREAMETGEGKDS